GEQTVLSKTIENLEPGKTYYWRVDSKNDMGTVSGPVWSFKTKELISSSPVLNIQGFKLETSPNPFKEYSTITFSIPDPFLVRINVHNANGSLVKVLTNKKYEAGAYVIDFYRENLSPGLYILRMETNEGSLLRKLLID
ncbi:MAG: T9SS type A sorting domain-containing protein, partial [Bacteroidales bacterium]|nr:T9SS type A sorting domain-containing protein [Bacteroidales bacterium]